ncbi:MAG TPA: hypothetical protein VF329_01635 [Gammaproteobacteria bacterium]
MKTIRTATICLAALVTGAAHAAYYYEAVTTVEGDGVGSQSSSVRGWVDGANARIEFVTGDPTGLFSAGSYLLSNDGGETLYVVDPGARTVAEVDLAQIFRSVGALTEATGGALKIEFSDFTTEQLGREAGAPIVGHATTRYRFKTGYTMSVGVLGFSRESRADTDLEISCTEEIDDAGFAVWLRPDRFRTGDEDIDRLIAQQVAIPGCVTLRNRSVTTMTAEGGRASTTTTTMEVTALREEAPPEAAFVLPADYERTSFFPDLSELGATPPPEEASGEGRGFGLRDLIGR